MTIWTMSKERAERVDRIARSFAPAAWEALGGRDTKAHQSRRAATTVMAQALEFLQRTRKVKTRQADDIGYHLPACDRGKPGRSVSPALSALVKLGLVHRFSGPGYIGSSYELSEAGAAYMTPDEPAVQATSPAP